MWACPDWRPKSPQPIKLFVFISCPLIPSFLARNSTDSSQTCWDTWIWICACSFFAQCTSLCGHAPEHLLSSAKQGRVPTAASLHGQCKEIHTSCSKSTRVWAWESLLVYKNLSLFFLWKCLYKSFSTAGKTVGLGHCTVHFCSFLHSWAGWKICLGQGSNSGQAWGSSLSKAAWLKLPEHCSLILALSASLGHSSGNKTDFLCNFTSNHFYRNNRS